MTPQRGLALVGLLASSACGGSSPVAPLTAPSAPGAPVSVAYLVGDAGAEFADSRLRRQLHSEVAEGSRHAETFVVFLGDNIYPRGLSPTDSDDRTENERRLEAQLAVVRGTQATALFIPGNHDWGSGAAGWHTLKRQVDYLDEKARAGERVRVLPQGGCPGPESLDTRGARFIALDTEWWLRPPRERPANCRPDTEAEVLTALVTELDAGDRPRVVLGHHPLKTQGPHGGHFDFGDYLFPGRNLWSGLLLPLPFAYPAFRRAGVSNQDLAGSRNVRFRTALSSAFARASVQPLAYASGHEHGLQVFDGAGAGAAYLLVSGAASSVEPIDPTDTLFATGAGAGELGYMRLEFFGDGRVLLSVFTDGSAERPGPSDKAALRYHRWLSEKPGSVASR